MAANKDQYRVTKAAVARKSCNEAAYAVGYKVYVDELGSKFEATYKELEEKYTDLKTKYDAAIKQLHETKYPQQPCIDAAATEVDTNQQHKINDLEAQIATLKSEKDDLEAQLTVKTPSTNEELELEVLQLKSENQSQRKKIEMLNSKLAVGPNSWFEIHVRSGRKKARDYVKRPTVTFEEFVAQIEKDAQKKKDQKYTFRLYGKEIAEDQYAKTLHQLGIKAGDDIWYD